ncbi:MAG: metallopeptidase TldD-related protein [Promethearchaeota archaeon]
MSIIQNILSESISYGKRLGATFVELRSQSVERTTIELLDGKGDAIHGSDQGTAIRVIVDGTWGFVSVASFDPQILKKGVRDAYSIAKLGAKNKRESVELYPVQPFSDRIKKKWDVDPREIPSVEKKDRFVDMHKRIINSDEKNRILGSTVAYADITGIQYYQNSDDIEVTMDKCITWAKINANGKDGIIRAGAREEMGSSSGYTPFNQENLEEVAEILAQRIITNIEAKNAKGGVFPAVLAPSVAGVFAHEACGHLFEADITETGIIGTTLGKKIASEHATIIDDGTIPDAIGSFPYDDEGTSVEKTTILDQGRVSALLTNREYAHKFTEITKNTDSDIAVAPSGNARAFDFRVEPLIRMRNTYFAPGDFTMEELLEGINFGYYFIAFLGGEASGEGTFTVGVNEAFEIVKGELGQSIRGVSISGNTMETLLGISGAGKKETFHVTAGRCGKFQTAFTGDGGPLVRVNAINVVGEG